MVDCTRGSGPVEQCRGSWRPARSGQRPCPEGTPLNRRVRRVETDHHSLGGAADLAGKLSEGTHQEVNVIGVVVLSRPLVFGPHE